MKQLLVRIDDDTYEELQKDAVASDRSVSGQIRYIIKGFLKEKNNETY